MQKKAEEMKGIRQESIDELVKERDKYKVMY